MRWQLTHLLSLIPEGAIDQCASALSKEATFGHLSQHLHLGSDIASCTSALAGIELQRLPHRLCQPAVLLRNAKCALDICNGHLRRSGSQRQPAGMQQACDTNSVQPAGRRLMVSKACLVIRPGHLATCKRRPHSHQAKNQNNFGSNARHCNRQHLQRRSPHFVAVGAMARKSSGTRMQPPRQLAPVSDI